jgi:hypothetical protein
MAVKRCNVDHGVCCAILGSAVIFVADTRRQSYKSCNTERYLRRHAPKSFSLP